MKKKILFRAACGSAAAGLALLTASCDKPAPGLAPVASSEGAEKSVYDGVGKTGTSGPSAAPVTPPAAKPAASTEKPATPPAEKPEVAKTTPPPAPPPTTPAPPTPPAPTPPPTPPATATPAPAPAPAAPAPAAVAGANGKFSIKPAMPKPLFAGTPLPDNNPPPNLDKTGKPVLEVEVPEGVQLLSKGKTVTTSDPAPLGDLSLITDGDKEGDDGYFVDILPGKQWVQVDLGEAKEIHLIWLWHYHKVAAIYKDVVVQISDDPEFKNATTVFNNDFDNSSGFGVGTDQSWVETNNGRPIPVKAVKGRYVRFWSNGRNVDDTNHYIEVEVYGK